MTNPMTPAELRWEANRLRLVADLNAARGWENNAESCRRGADALDRLAEIRETMTDALTESDADEAEGGAGWDVEVDARWVLRIAEGGA